MKLEIITNMELDGITPYNFEKTIRKYTLYGIEWYLFTPFEVYSNRTLWTAIRINNMSVGLRLNSIGNIENPKISVSVFSKDKLSNDEENEIMNVLTWVLGLKIDITDFYILADTYKPLKQAKEDLYGMRITTSPNLFDLTLLALTLQRSSYGRTERMIRLICENYGELLEFDEKKIIIFPTAERISKVNENELRVRCKVGYRATNIIANAKLIASGKIPSLIQLREISAEDAKHALMQMKGIGEYSREIILFALHPCFPIDVWSANIFCKLFEIEIRDNPRKTMSILKEFAQKWFGKWQSYAYDYIINDLERLSNKFRLDI